MSYPIDFSKAVRDAGAAALNNEVPFEKKYPGAVRGGMEVPDFEPLLGIGNKKEVTIGPVAMTVGGDPNEMLFRKIYIDHAPGITAKINNKLITDDQGFISSYSAGFSGDIKGVGVNAGVTYETPADNKKAFAALKAFDIMYLDKVIEWTNNPNNKNGAQINADGGGKVAYTKEMVDEIRSNATIQKRNKEKEGIAGVFGSIGGEELPSQSVALTPGKNSSVVASATPEILTGGAQSLEFKNNPRVQEIYAALDRNGENQNPSLVAGLAGAAANANLSKVQDVALTPTTAFALDRDKFDPAANRASVSMDVANKPFDEVWKTASVALQQTQPPVVVAQAQDLEQKQSQSAPRM
jgi:hypothetical protein